MTEAEIREILKYYLYDTTIPDALAKALHKKMNEGKLEPISEEEVSSTLMDSYEEYIRIPNAPMTMIDYYSKAICSKFGVPSEVNNEHKE